VPTAIAVLAGIDHDTAERAFSRAWRLHRQARAALASLAPQIGAGAVAVVAGELPLEEDEAVQRAVHLALRRGGGVALEAVGELARSTRRADRRAAAKALGWIPGGDELLRSLTEDADPDVRSAARQGLLRQERERTALAYLADIGDADRFELVDYLLSILEPELAGDPSDAISVAPLLEGSPVLAAFAGHRLDERLRDVGRHRPVRRRRLRIGTAS
jgi:hypothetical protein